jgi:hypothetical protein
MRRWLGLSATTEVTTEENTALSDRKSGPGTISAIMQGSVIVAFQCCPPVLPIVGKLINGQATFDVECHSRHAILNA